LILIASFSGMIGGLWLKFRGQLDDNGQLAFGPFLVVAGLWVMAFGPLPWFLI
jgi:leader peptidase (prepilin peptidase)/N-methyltransferase